MNIDDYDEFPDPDYGVFGDRIDGYRIDIWRHRSLSESDLKRIQQQSKRREAERKVSSDFNRYMIDLFNQRSR